MFPDIEPSLKCALVDQPPNIENVVLFFELFKNRNALSKEKRFLH